MSLNDRGVACRKPRNIPRPGADSSGNPHPDQTAANKAKGVDVMLIMQYTRQGLQGSTYKVNLLDMTWYAWPVCACWGRISASVKSSRHSRCVTLKCLG